MRLGGFLELGGTELANDLRTLAYIRDACLPGWGTQDCECDAYDDGPYGSPVSDPAPWYVATDPRSEDFMGLLLNNVRILDPFSRQVTERAGVGSALGRLRLGHRVVVAEGMLVASSCEGMAFGQRWVSEVLRGTVCATGCGSDDLCIATHCDADGVRMLRNAGLVDGPVFSDATTPPDCTVQEIAFQIASEMPYLYASPEVVRNETLVAAGSMTDLISTEEWVADAALRIVLEASDTDATDLRVAMRVALGGECPDLRVPPCYDVSIPLLPANSVLTLDATRRRVTWRDPLTLQERSGLHLLDFLGALSWPEVPPCTDICLTVSNDGAQDVALLVESFPREI